MGHKLSCMKGTQSQLLQMPVPSYGVPWGTLWADTLANWQHRAESFGFLEHPYRCLNRECNRNAVCLKQASALLHRGKHAIEVQRYKDPIHVVSYSDDTSLRQKINLGFALRNVVAAMKEELVLLVLYRGESLQYEAVFVLVNLHACKIQAWFAFPVINMSVVESNISPDESKVAVLFCQRNATSSCLLYIFCAETGHVQEIVPCKSSGIPCVAFDPRFGWARVAMMNYPDGYSIRDSLVLYSLQKKEVIAVSDAPFSILCSGSGFSVRYSRDGNYIILQIIHVAFHEADYYVFNSDTLTLLKQYQASLPLLSLRCQTNYTPLHSKCGSRICMQTANQKRVASVCIYQLPRPIGLRQQCRISILQNVESTTAIRRLPLPKKLRDFLLFIPEH